MTDLPRGWVEARLDELLAAEPAAITDGPFGSNLKTEHYTESGPRVIRLQNIGDGVFRDERAHISRERFDALKKHEVLAGDLVIAALGEELPRSCVVPEGLGPAIVKADCIRARLHPLVNSRFVNAMLNSQPVRRAATSEISGIGRPRLNLAKIRSIRVPVPPTPEQERIVAVIEEQFSRLDDAERQLRHARTRCEQLRIATIVTALRGDWPVKRIGELATVGSGATPKRGRADYYEDGTIPWVTSGQVVSDFVTEPAAYITEKALKDTSVKLWPKHTLLVAMYGEGRTRGHCSELLFESTTNQACAAIVLDERGPIRRDFLKLFFAANYERNRRLASGGVQPNLSLGLIRAMEVPLPPPDTQQRIVGEVDRQLTVIAGLYTAIGHALIRSDHVRRSVLDRALSGRLVRQDSSDEPASALLENIAAVRAEAPDRRRRKSE